LTITAILYIIDSKYEEDPEVKNVCFKHDL
jgi:hypothetical protein